MPVPSPVDPVLALRWLSQARRGIVIAQALLCVVTVGSTDVQLPLAGLAVGLGLLLVVDAIERRRIAAREPTVTLVRAHAAFDLLALTAILLATGGAQNPLQAFYLVLVALLAVVLPGRDAWIATSGAVALQAVATTLAPDLPGLDEEPHHHLGHLVGHVVAFDLAALAICGFVGRLSAQLRDREDALRAAQAERAHADRLAALGTLAAGTAHALGTPLGAIELLAEELAAGLPADAAERAAFPELVGQVRRSREILDRMLAGGTDPEGRTHRIGDLTRGWVEEWAAAHGTPVQVEVDESSRGLDVRGDPDGWRDALWTVLDNAREAGGDVRLALVRAGPTVELRVDDGGPRVRPEQLSRAGQPFYSAWPARKGAGLGLYVVRSFARAAGGDLRLDPLPDRGARATLLLPEAT